MNIAEEYIMKWAKMTGMTPGQYSANYYVSVVDPCMLAHGYIFTDGSCLDIDQEDHRSIPAEEWPKNQIATFSFHKDNITLRIHGGVTLQQMESIMHTKDTVVWYVAVKSRRDREYRVYNKPELFELMNDNYKGV